MILQQLTLRDFGLFKGRQVLDLAPTKSVGRGRPIVLFGGVNGAGKTTILDAIQLVLYGVRARCSKRSNLPYEEFLARSIHQGMDPATGAEILLLFHTVAEEQDAYFEVRRSWHVREGRLKEILSVFKDGVYDAWYSDNWSQQVEELVPLEISQLFFFDAEKIRTLTEDETSSQALGAAIKSLLGLDIVERLIADTAVIQARQAKEGATAGHREKVEVLERQAQELSERIRRLVDERGALENHRLRAEAAQQTAEWKFTAAGGKYWELRQIREGRKKELETRAGETVEREFAQEDRARIVQVAARTRTTMQDFLRRATDRKIDRLSGLITESFRFLLRKKSMVERILIDPGTFAITLYDSAGGALSKERLSEGEKQVFAISVLWGLARASNRPLPAVIDTPMARLDATHRRNLVERYFPNASHQVVILSTDTEVDRDYYQALQPHIARAYHLSYDEGQRMTVAEEGYFWKDVSHASSGAES